MARPSSTAQTVRKHLTKQEQQAREEAENALRSGLAIREDPDVAADPAAHAEFVRVVELLSSIGKNEALYEGAINRYCQLKAECAQHVRLLRAVNARIVAALTEEPTASEAAEAISELKRSAQEYETLLRQKRTMLLAIEKECCMTVSGAARTVPKKPEQKANPLALALADD